MNLGGRNKIVVIAAGAVIVVAVVVILFVMRGGKGAEEGAPAAGGFAQGTGEAGSGGAGAPAPGTGAPGLPGGGAEGPAGVGAAAAGIGAEAAGGGAYPSVGVVKMGIGPTEPSRIDPFETFNPPVTAPPPEVMVSLPAVGLVQGGLRPGGLTGVAKIGSRRIAGLTFSDQAYAILEDEDRKTYIVKPGDIVEGIRIIAISRDSVFIRDRDGNRWEVPLRGMEPSTSSGSAENSSELSQTPPV